MDARGCESSRRGNLSLARLSVILTWAGLTAYAADFAALMVLGADAKSGTSMLVQGVLVYVTPFLVATTLVLRLLRADDVRRTNGLVRHIVVLAVILCAWVVLLQAYISSVADIAVVRTVGP